MYSRHYKPAVATINAPLPVFHDLRHTYAAWSIRAGKHLKELQVHMGHATYRITADTYGHLEVLINEETMSRMDALLSQGDHAEL